jgi:hypothetical protein
MRLFLAPITAFEVELSVCRSSIPHLVKQYVPFAKTVGRPTPGDPSSGGKRRTALGQSASRSDCVKAVAAGAAQSQLLSFRRVVICELHFPILSSCFPCDLFFW